MELHSPLTAKKLWNFLRIAFFMMRKGLISKRKLVTDMHLMMQRGKLMGKTLANLMFHRHPNIQPPLGPSFGMHEYEFSCSNTPNPIFFHVNGKRRHSYFPCIHAAPTIDELEEARGPVIVLPRIEYSPSSDLTPGQRRTPLRSPFSVRVSNYSMDEEEEGDGSGRQVDAEAEEFIKRFYEQLRKQGRVALLQYQETE